MAAFTFSQDEAGTFTLRKALFRMIATRAARRLTDPADLAELRESEAMEGLGFDLLDADQRGRVLSAVAEATAQLRREVATGEPTEEPVLPGAAAKLDDLLDFLAREGRADKNDR
jgi:hypothetical protein